MLYLELPEFRANFFLLFPKVDSLGDDDPFTIADVKI